MKAVMISIKPKWCELIAKKQKTIEVRKTKPKLKTPFKCYIYCTKASKKHQTITGCMVLNSDELFRHPKQGVKYGNSIELMLCEPGEYGKDNFLNGKVIGEFICDDISINLVGYSPQKDESAYWTLLNDSCLTKNELMEYGKYHFLYGWHISNLVIYDRPKDIIEFTPYCKYLNDDGSCQYEKIECDCAKTDFNPDYSFNIVECLNYMTRPPQSWCYVEDKEE